MNQPEPADAVSVAIGASGGIGGALLRRMQGTGGFGGLIGLSRVSSPALATAGCGWYSYRASKAALNQMLHTAAAELRRSHRHAVCVALHPGTVNTRFSALYSKAGLELQGPDLAAERLPAVIEGPTPDHSGRFFDHRGEPVPW